MKNAKPKQAIVESRRRGQFHNRAKRLIARSAKEIDKMSSEDIAGLVRDLNAYQVELHSRNTELSRIQTELEESRNKISDMYDFVPMGYFTFDRNYLIVDANQTGAELLNVERDALLAKPFTDFVTPNFKDVFTHHCMMTIDKQTTQTCRLKLIRNDGCEFYAELDCLAVKGAGGNHGRIRISVKDITERRRTMEEITRLAAIVESSDDAINGTDLAGRITTWNRAAERIYGYTANEVRGKSVSILIPPENTDSVPDIVDKIKRGRKIEHFETVRMTKQGRRIHVSLSISPIKDADGNIVGASAIARDITERKRMEQALIESEEKMRSILDASPDAILQVGMDLNVLWANKAALELNPDILGKSCCEAYQPCGCIDPNCVCRKAIESGQIETQSMCYPIEDRAGNEVYWENTGVPLQDSQGRVYGSILIARDITERKMAEKAMLEYQQMLRNQASQLSLAEERERRRIATNLHDNIIQGLALSMIRLDLLRESGDVKDVRLLNEVSETIMHTIEDMRDMTFDISSPTLYRFGLSAAVDELLDDLLKRRHSIDYEFNDDQQEKPLDDDVRVLLFQSVRELLINIIKHADAHKVWVSIERVGDSIFISIKDDGVGFEVDNMHLNVHRAGGFGLFNIRERLDYTGGGIEIHSQPGKGSRFVLTAPLRSATGSFKGIEDGAENTIG